MTMSICAGPICAASICAGRPCASPTWRVAILRGADLRGAAVDETDAPAFGVLWGRPVLGPLRKEWPARWRAIPPALALVPLVAALALALANALGAIRASGRHDAALGALAASCFFGVAVYVVVGKLLSQFRALVRDPRLTVTLAADPRAPDSPVAIVALTARAPLARIRVRVVCRQLLGHGEAQEWRDAIGPDLYRGDDLGLVAGMIWQRSLPLDFPIASGRVSGDPEDEVADHWRVVVTTEGPAIGAQRHFPFALERS